MKLPREKPHRLPQESYVGQIAISFTVCVADRRQVLLDPGDIYSLVPILREQFEAHECRIPIYCFMPDHLHLVSMGMTQYAEGKRAMDGFKVKSGQFLYSSSAGYAWQRNYYDRIIRRPGEWRKKVFYVFCNPVRAGLVEDPWTYPLTGSIGYDLEELVHEAAW